MDFHGMKRKELQRLCRKHGVPANLKNCEMADRLALIFKKTEESILEEQSSSENSGKSNSVNEGLVEIKNMKKVKFSPESELFEFTRSVKKRARKNGRTKSEGTTKDFPNSGKLVGRPRRIAAKGKSGDVCIGLSEIKSDTKREPDVQEDRKVLRRSKRIACNDGAVIEQPHGSSSENFHEEGKATMLSKEIVNEPEMEDITQNNFKLDKVTRRSKRIARNVKEPCIGATALEIEPGRYAQDSQKGKVRRSRRIAKSEVEGESVKNSVDKQWVTCEAQTTDKCPGQDAPDVSEVEKVQRRSRRIAKSVTVQNAAIEINTNRLHLVDENLETGKQDYMEAGKASRQAKQIEANDGSQGGARKTSVWELEVHGDIQEIEKRPRSSAGNDFLDRELLRRSKRLEVDHNAQGGAPDFNADNQCARGRIQVTVENKRPTDDCLERRKAVRRSKRLAANDEDLIGVLGISEKPNIELKTQAAKGGTKNSTQIGLEAGTNFRRSKRFAATDDKQAEASGNNVKKPHVEYEKEMPLRYTRNASRHNSRKATERLDENPDDQKAIEALRPLVIAPTRAARKMKQDRSKMLGMDTEVISTESSLTLEEIVTDCAQLEPEAAGTYNGTEFGSIELTVTCSSKKRKMAKQEFRNEKPQGLIEELTLLSEAEAEKPAKSTEEISDSPSEKSVDAPKGTDSQHLHAELTGGEYEENDEEDTAVQAETDKLLSLSHFPSEGLSAGAKINNSGSVSEVKTCTASSSSDGYPAEEATGEKASAQLAESNVEAELDVLGAHTLSKDIPPVFMSEEDTQNNEETKASTLNSDPNEHIDIDEATAQGILEKCPLVIKSSPGYGKQICSSYDQGKASMEKEIHAACLSGDFSEYNAESSTVEEQTEMGFSCDTSCGKTSFKAMTVLSNPWEERMASKKEVVGVTSSEKYIVGADIGSEGMKKSSCVKQSNLLVMDMCLKSVQKALSTECVNHVDVVQTAESQETMSPTMPVDEETESEEQMTETMTDHDTCIETGIQEIEETNVQAKDTPASVASEIHAGLTTNTPKENNAAVMKSSISRGYKEGPGNKEEAEIRNLRHDGVLTHDEGKKLASGKCISGDCETLETLADVKYDSLRRSEENKFSDREDKKEGLDLSRCSATELASLASKEVEVSKVIEEQNMNSSSQLMLGGVNSSVIKEELASVDTGRWVDNPDLLEINEAAVRDACVVSENEKMGFGTVRNSSEMIEGMSLFAFSVGDKSKHVDTGISSPREDAEGSASKKRGIKAAMFRDESVIFTTPKRNLMLREQLDETGKTSAAESVAHYNDKAEESHDEPVIFTSTERHLLLEDSGLDEAGNKGENKVTEFQDESIIFTTPERHLLLGEPGSSEAGKGVETTAAKSHEYSVISSNPERHLSLGDTEIDEAGKNKEDKALQFCGESGIFPNKERNVVLGEFEPDKAENKGVDAAAELHDKTVVSTDEKRHPLLGGSELNEAEKGYGNKHVESHVESGLLNVPERDLLLGGCVINDGGSRGENTVAEFHEKSAIAPGPERHSLLENSEQDEAGKNAENKALEFHSEYGTLTTPERHLLSGVFELDDAGNLEEKKDAEFHGEAAPFTGQERQQLLGDSEMDEAGKSDENKAVEFHVESGLLISLERHLLSVDTGLDETGSRDKNAAAKFLDGSAIFSSSESRLLLRNSDIDEAGKSEDNKAMQVIDESAFFTCSERHLIWGESGLDGSGKKEENKEVEFQDESAVLTSKEGHLMLGDFVLDKVESLTEFNTKANESKTNAVTTTQDLEDEEDEYDMLSGINREHADGQSGKLVLSHSVSSPKESLATNTMAIESYDAPDRRENISIASNGPTADKNLHVPKFDAGQEEATELKPMDAQVEDFVRHNDKEETSSGCLGNLPQVESINFDGQKQEMMMDVEGCTLLDLKVLGLRMDGDSYEELRYGTHNCLTMDLQASETVTHTEKGSGGMNSSLGAQPEGGRVCSIMNPSSSPFASEESKPSIYSPDQMNDAREELMVTCHNTDNNGAFELTEATETANKEEGKMEAAIIYKSKNCCDKDCEGSLQLDYCGSHALAEDEQCRLNSEKVSGNTRDKDRHELHHSEATDLAASGESLSLFALQSRAHDSTPTVKAISLFEPTVPENSKEQDEKIFKSSRETLQGPSKDPDMEDTNTLLENQFSCFMKKRVGREPSLIHMTQVKPAKHDMKENAPNSKIEQTLNLTALRTSKRQPLQDLRKN